MYVTYPMTPVISVSMLLNVHLAAYHFLSVLGRSCVANQEGKKIVSCHVISYIVNIGISYSLKR